MKCIINSIKLLRMAVAVYCVLSAASAQVSVRIMALGDSITEGFVVPAAVTGGYRKELHSLLTTQGYAVDYVGTLKYPDAVSEGWVDGDHEGHSGYKIDDIRSEAAFWLKKVPNPDVILLHAGTNDFWSGGSLATAQNHLRSLLAELSALRPHARIIVASLVPRTDSFEAIQDQFNDSIPGIVTEQVTLGRKVTFVDMHDGFGSVPGDLSADGVHPSPSGYDKMATIWLPAITSVITPSGTTSPPVVASVDARVDLTSVTVSFSKPINDIDGNNPSNFSVSGVTVSAASLDASKRVVTLTTSPQAAGSIRTLTVSGIRDRMVPENLIAPGTTVSFLSRTIVDGSFEQNAASWTQTGNVTIPVSTSPEASDGSKLAVFSDGDTPNTGRISQTFTTIPGREYQLQYDMGVYASDTSAQQLQITIKDGAGGPADQNLLPPQSETLNGIGTTGNPLTQWQLKSLEFTAVGTSSTISFQDTSAVTAGVDLLLDDVRIASEVNTVPVAADDGGIGFPYITVTENSGATESINVLANDSDADNDPLTITTATSSNGAVSITGGQTLSFTPTTGFVGNTTISYTISDGEGGTDSAQLWIAVAAVGPFENGSFESGSPVDFGNPAGWEINGGVFGYSTQGFYLTKSGNGNWMAVFNGGINSDTASLSQSFTTVVGQSYTVQFDAGLAAGVGSKTQIINAAVTGTLTPPGQTTSWPISSTAAPAQWVQPGKSFTFTASSTSTTLTFSVAVSPAEPATQNVDLLLDNVRVTASASGNQPPVAVADSYTTAFNTPLSVAPAGVLANDTDDGPPPLVAVIGSQPNNGGSVILDGNGGFVYTPAPGFVGTEFFTYHAFDGSLSSSVVPVSVTVIAQGSFVNGSFENGAENFEAPENWDALGVVTYADATNYIPASGNGAWMAVFNPGANSPAISTLSQQFGTVAGREYSVSFDAGLAGGVGAKSQALQVAVSGESNPPPSRSWLFASSSPVVTWAARNFSFVAGGPLTTLTFTVDISAGGSANNVDLALDDVVVTPVGGSNQAPVASDDGSVGSAFLTVAEDSGASAPITVLGNDSDPDFDLLTVTQASSPNGVVAINSGSTLVFTPTANFNGAATISYTVSDVLGGTDTATVFIQVTSVNDAPVAVNDGSIGSPVLTVAEDSGVSAPVPVLGNDTDTELNTLTITEVSSPNGTVAINSGITLGFTPALDFHGATTISYTISDGQGGTSSATAFVTVTPVNDPPVALDEGSIGSPFLTVAEDSVASAPINVLANDTDVELGSITVTSASSPNGAVDINSGGTLSFTPAENFNGPTTISYTISDGSGGTASATVFVSVSSVNDLPLAVNDGSIGSPFLILDEDSGASAPIAVLSNDTDVEPGALTVTSATSPNGTVTVDSGATLGFTPALNFSGAATISYAIADGQGGTANATVFVQVTPVNDAPVAVAGMGSVAEDTPLGVNLVASDVDAGDVLIYQVVSGPASGSVDLVGTVATYTPNPNFHGSDSFTFKAVDSGLLSSAETVVSITVTSVDDAPVANDQSVSLDEDGSATITLTGSDDGAPSLSYAVLGGPSHGSLRLNGAVATYTPDPNFYGQDSFYFIALTFSGGPPVSAIATVSITVNPVNDPPIAVARTASLNEDGILQITLTANDPDPTDSLVFTPGVVAHGALIQNGSVVTYTPNPNYNGSDAFTFTVNDGTVDSLPAVVSITVNSVNDAPVAVDDGSSGAPFVTIDEDSGVSLPITILANDSDPDPDVLAVTQANSNDGTVAINPDKTLAFTPTLNFNGPTTISYTIADGQGGTASATVYVSVTPVNDAPEGMAQVLSVNEDGTLNITLSGSDLDADITAEGLIYTVTVDPIKGSLTGVGRNRVYSPNLNFNGADSFTFKVNDGGLDSPAVVVSLTVDPVNDAPVAVNDGSPENPLQTIAEDSGILTPIVVLGNDSDVDLDPLTVTLSSSTNGLVAVNPDNTLGFTPAADFNGTAVISYTVSDGSGSTAVGTVFVAVSPVNDSPVAVNDGSAEIPFVTMDEDAVSAPISVLANDTDVDPDTLAVTAASSPDGVVTVVSPTTLSFAPASDFNGATTISYTISDGQGGSSGATVFVSVTPVNDAPLALAAAATVNEDGSASITLTGSDVDAAEVLAFSKVTDPSNGSVTVVDGVATYIPNRDYNGPDSFTFKTNDGDVDSLPATISISVTPVNDAPVPVAQAVSLDEDGSLAITLSGSDPDGDITAENLNYVVTANPLNGSLGVSGRNLVYTPFGNYAGADSITFTVNDGALDSAPAVVSITVNPVNDAPTAIAGNATVSEDGSVNITLTGSDPDAGEVLSFFKVTDPASGSVSVVNGVATYVPNLNFNGSDSFTFRANDGDVDSAPATVSITVTPVDDRPVANAQSVSVNEDGSRMITLTGSDVDGDTLFYTIPGKPPHGNVTLSGAVTTYTPDPNYNGPDSITFFAYSIVSGSPVFSTSAVISITVNPVNDAPVATAQSVSVNEDSVLSITLAGSDADGDALVFAAGLAGNGSVSLSGSVVTYTPAPNFSGTDSFTFTVTDGTAVSAPATVSITVIEVVDPGFSDWLAGFSLTADPQTDSDHDSISNAVEYVIGGNPATRSDTDLLPTLELMSANLDGNPGDEDYLVFTYRRTDLARDDPATGIEVEWCTDVAGPWSGTAGMMQQVIEGDGLDFVKVFIPRTVAAGGRLFGRLAVEISTPLDPQ